MSNMDCQLLRQKLRQKISVVKTNNLCFHSKKVKIRGLEFLEVKEDEAIEEEQIIRSLS